MKKSTNVRISLVVGILVLLVWFLVAPAFAQSPVRIRRQVPADGDGVVNLLPKDKVTIAKKSLESVFTNVGRRYAVTKATLIVGLDGQQVSIKEMLVPCEAEVTYTKEKNVRTAQRISIKKVSPKATWYWVGERPE